jgi:hypothetical protein
MKMCDFSNTEDVDLIVGGILETPTHGMVLGPTFTCLLAQQFISVRNSDRFWYENDIPPSSFTRGNNYVILCNHLVLYHHIIIIILLMFPLQWAIL